MKSVKLGLLIFSLSSVSLKHASEQKKDHQKKAFKIRKAEAIMQLRFTLQKIEQDRSIAQEVKKLYPKATKEKLEFEIWDRKTTLADAKGLAVLRKYFPECSTRALQKMVHEESLDYFLDEEVGNPCCTIQ